MILPPGVQSTTLAAFPQIAYDRTAILEWQFNTPFLEELCDFRPLPRRSGRTLQFYGQQPFAAATYDLSEGIPGPSLQLTQVFSDAFADEYGDWIGISNVAQQMFLSDITMDASRNLSYRGALTSNLIAINGFEAAATAQTSAAHRPARQRVHAVQHDPQVRIPVDGQRSSGPRWRAVHFGDAPVRCVRLHVGQQRRVRR